MKRVFAFIGFTVAITLFVLNIVSLSAVKYIVLIAVVLFAVSLAVSKFRKARVMPVILGGVILACVFYSCAYGMFLAPQLQLDGKEAEATFCVVDIPTVNNNDEYCYTVKIKSVDQSGTPANFKARVKCKKQLDADFYDSVTARLKFYSIADNAFDSYGYYGKGIFLSARLDDGYLVLECENKPVGYNLLKLRLYIKSVLENAFEVDTGALASSILMGDKSSLSNEAYYNFKVCGVTHITAVSGMHTSIVCFGLYAVLRFLKSPKPIAVSATLLATLMYIALADFSKSAIRAGIMIAVLLISKLFKRRGDTLNSLGMAVFIICLNPFAVCDVGALLSVCAVLGIVVIYPHISSFTDNIANPIRYVVRSIMLTLSIIAATLPVACVFFDSLSLVGLFLNVLFVPLLQPALISVLLFALFNKIEFLAFFPKLVAELSLNIMLRATAFCAEHFSRFAIDLRGKYMLAAVSACLLVAGILLVVYKKLPVKITTAIVCVILIGGCVLSTVYNSRTVMLECYQSGAVIVTDNDSVIGINVNKPSDTAIIKMKAYGGKRVVIIDSTAENKLDIDDNILAYMYKGRICLLIFNNTFEIIENDVIINGKKFKPDSDYTLYVSKNEDVMVRRFENG